MSLGDTTRALGDGARKSCGSKGRFDGGHARRLRSRMAPPLGEFDGLEPFKPWGPRRVQIVPLAELRRVRREVDAERRRCAWAAP